MASTTITGSYSGSNASNYGIRCVCSSTSNGSSANTSNVTVSLQMRRAVNTGYEGQWSADGSATGRIMINGSDSGTSAVYFDTRNTLDWITLKTYTVKNIAHNSDGSKTIPIKAYFEPNATSSLYGGVVSGNFVLDTIPRASTVSATDAYIEGKPTITISRASSSFVHTLYWGTGSTQPTSWTQIVSKTTSVSYSSWAIPTSVYALCKNALKYQYVWIRCDTYASSSATSAIGTTYAKLTANVNQSTNKPNLSVTWSNTDYSSLTGNAATLIRYVSSVTASMTWSAKNQATISSAQMMCTDGQYQTTSPAVINNVGAGTFIAKVTDSRNLTTEITKTYTMVNYVIPSITVVASRPQPTTGQVKLSVSGAYFNGTFGSVANTITLVYRYKEKGASTWGSWKNGLTATLSGNTYTANAVLSDSFDYTKAFDFQVNIEDKINTRTGSASVSQGIPVFDWGEEDFNFNVPLKYQNKNYLEVVYPVGSIYMSTSGTSPASLFGGTWEQLKNRFLVGCGDTYNAGATGGEATHTLITSETPNHSGHIMGIGNGSLKAYLSTSALTSYGSTGRGWTSPSGGEALPATTSTGGGQAHNNMPPYLAVYMWKRTA